MTVSATAMSLYAAHREWTECPRGGLVAQQFLDQRHDEVRFVAQSLQHLRVAQQRQHAVGDEVDDGLMAGDEEQFGGGDDVGVGHPTVRPVVVGQP